MIRYLPVLLLLAACDSPDLEEIADERTPCEIRADVLCSMRDACSGYEDWRLDQCIELEIRYCENAPDAYSMDDALSCSDGAAYLEPCHGQYYPPDTCRAR